MEKHVETSSELWPPQFQPAFYPATASEEMTRQQAEYQDRPNGIYS
jgi:hypothetical protein